MNGKEAIAIILVLISLKVRWFDGRQDYVHPVGAFLAQHHFSIILFRVKRERLSQQLWAYNTLEGYGVKGCPYYPTNDCLFSSLSLFSGGKIQSEIDWQVQYC